MRGGICQSPSTTTPAGRPASRLTMLIQFSYKRNFSSLLRILFLLCTSSSCSLYLYLCPSFPLSSRAPLYSTCSLAASCMSSPYHSIRVWSPLGFVFPLFCFEGSVPPFRLGEEAPWRPHLLLTAAATVKGYPASSLPFPPHKPPPLLVPSGVSSPPVTNYSRAASALPGCTEHLTRRPRARVQFPHGVTYVNDALCSLSLSRSLSNGSPPRASQVLGEASNSVSRLSGAAAAADSSNGRRPAIAASLGLLALGPRQQEQRSSFCRASTWDRNLRPAGTREAHEQRKGSHTQSVKGQVLLPMALSVTSFAASAAFYLDRKGSRCLHGAAGVWSTVTRRLAAAAITAALHGEPPAAAAAARDGGTGAAAAPHGCAFPTSAAPCSHCTAFAYPRAATSHCDAVTTAGAAGSEWRIRATAKLPPSTRTLSRQSYSEASLPSAMQQCHTQPYAWHRSTRLLAQRPVRVSDRREGGTSLWQQRSALSPLRPFSSLANSSCVRAAPDNQLPHTRKRSRMAVHDGTTTAEEAARRQEAVVAVRSRPYATATAGRRSYAERGSVADVAEADAEAAAVAAREPPSPQQLQTRRQHARRFTHTKQIATIGPASWSFEEIERLFLSGVDVFRLNLSHGLLHEKHQQLQHVRHVEQKYGHPIAVLADLPGPKLRLGSFEGDDAIFLPEGATFVIDNAATVLGNQHRVALPQHTEVLHALRAGDVLLLDDGKLKLQVLKRLDCSKEAYEQLLRQRNEQHTQEEQQQRHQGVEQQDQHRGQKEETSSQLRQQQCIGPEHNPQNPCSASSFPERVVGVECVVSVGGPLSGKKGVNIPAAALPLSALSARDRELARLVAGWGVDWIALSFVQRSEDVRELRKELQAQAALLERDTTGAGGSTSMSNNSSRVVSSTSCESASCRKSSTGEEAAESVSGKEQLVHPPLVQNRQLHGEQHQNQDEMDAEQQRRLLRSSEGLREGKEFAAFAPAHVRRGGEVAVIVKIEKPLALENIEEILEEADGLMVARGDLGVELAEHAAWLPVVQKRLVKLCHDAGKPVVIATQMLDSMTHAPAPTRAELTDVANAVYDGADAVMLSGETAAGTAPAHVAKTQLQGIQAVEADPHFWRLQNATRRLLLDKEAARAASRCATGRRTSSSHVTIRSRTSRGGGLESGAGAHGDAWESCGPAHGGGGGEQGVAAEAAAAPARDAPVAAPGNVRGGAGEAAKEGLEKSPAGEGGEEVGREKEEHAGKDLHEQALAVSVKEHEHYFALDSNLRGRRTGQGRLFPELRGGRLPWKKQLTRTSDVHLGGQQVEDLVAAARRAAAVAAASFVGDECWMGSSHSSSRDSRGRSRIESTALHEAQRADVSAANNGGFGEVADAAWVAAAAEQASRLSGATGIVIFEETGKIARRVAALRPVVPVVAVTPSAYVARELQLHWGIYPVVDAMLWETTKDIREGKSGTTGRGGRGATENEEGASERIEATKAGSKDMDTRTRAENRPQTPQEKHGEKSEGITMRMRQKSWRNDGPSFGTQMSKAASLLVGEGMADASGDEKAVVVGFYTREKEGAATRERHQEAVSLYPQISVCRIKAFL